MKALKIDKGIPIPTRRGSLAPEREVLKKLKVGDSVLFPDLTRRPMNLAHQVLGGGNYTIRKEVTGYRIWRTK